MIHNNKLKIPLLFLLLSTLVVCLSGCNIRGSVTLDGEGLTNVAVTLSGQNITLQTVTDARGNYVFSDIEAGTYVITAELQPRYAKNSSLTVAKLDRALSVSKVNFSIDSITQKELPQGTVVGSVETNGVYSWRGIPYAEPPIGELRWKSPRSVESHGGIYPAITAGSACVQNVGPLSSLFSQGDKLPVGDEDCLYLNVWAPSNNTDLSKSPVMFWIHGGGNIRGQGATYNGKDLAEDYGVVVVTLNYRLGPLGWFYYPPFNEVDMVTDDASGNYGTLDAIKALHWVRDHIAAFGGDPDNITVFGESAGAANTLVLLSSPLSSGLFHRAVVQSGYLDWATQTEAYQYEEAGGDSFSTKESINKLLIIDGLATDRESAMVIQNTMNSVSIGEYLRSKSAEELLTVYGDGSGVPVLIRDGYVIPNADPLSVFASGQYHKMPTILGTNRDEAKFFMAFDPEFVDTYLGIASIVKDKSYYELTAYYFSKYWKLHGVEQIARAMQESNNDNVFVYRFDWDEEPSYLDVDFSFLLGAAHGFEVPFVFNDSKGSNYSIFSSIIYNAGNSAGREYLASTMSSYWAEFAYSGEPKSGFGANNNAAWLPWNKNRMLVFDTREDQGIRMATEEVTADSLALELQTDTRFESLEKRCTLYESVIGIDNYYQSQCL